MWADSTEDQVLVNLVLNAREREPAGGQLTIETASVKLDEERLAAEKLTVPPACT